MRSNESVPTMVYTPEPKLRHPLDLLKEMARDARSSRELAWRLMVRDLSAKYRQSLFGLLWAFLPPIVTGFIFIFLHSQGVIDVGRTEVPYPVFVLFGTTLWQVFAESLSAPLSSFTSAKGILVSTSLRHEAILLAGLGQVLFNFVIRLLILAAVFVVFSVPLTPAILLALVAALMLVLLGIAIGLLLVPIGLLYTDVSYGLTTATTLWFFVTPVVYPIPKSWPFSLLEVANPVSPLLMAARDLATKGSVENVAAVAIVSGLTLLALVSGWVAMRLAVPIVVERMGA